MLTDRSAAFSTVQCINPSALHLFEPTQQVVSPIDPHVTPRSLLHLNDDWSNGLDHVTPEATTGTNFGPSQVDHSVPQPQPLFLPPFPVPINGGFLCPAYRSTPYDSYGHPVRQTAVGQEGVAPPSRKKRSRQATPKEERSVKKRKVEGDRKSRASDNPFANIIKSKRFSEAGRVLASEWKPAEVCGLLHLPKNATKSDPRPTVPCMIGKPGGCGGTVNLTVSGYLKHLKDAHPEIEDRLGCYWKDDPNAAKSCHCRQRHTGELFKDAASVSRHILRRHLHWGTPCPMPRCESTVWDVKYHLVQVHICDGRVRKGHSDGPDSDDEDSVNEAL
ncbi:hypothetical protein FISHEDRAFT_70392 [Fistulina hepatica ATCC 64428]|uniref:Uncharacterized protein n=1 Tax=Fistulina hepatica ATCC 64428 TaxID=1128425 RepID=A0A0D7AJZ6_9AGAR|nr:hypothetical protein FISHEDRAFT_70392 [Fistulina hepatica ATCC 64428]